MIAFSSDRFDNDDIFVVPAGGGTAKRLTFHSATDTPAARQTMSLSTSPQVASATQTALLSPPRR